MFSMNLTLGSYLGTLPGGVLPFFPTCKTQMKGNYLKKVMTASEVCRVMLKIAEDIVENHSDLDHSALVGIRRRGVPLTERLQKEIERLSGARPQLGVLDITFYRDDLSMVDTQPVVGATHLNFDISGKTIFLVDDVLYTGRTARAAIDSIIDYGRPKKIVLVVLIDRGHRELPIQGDYVGKSVETAASEVVEVRLRPIDEEEGVYLTSTAFLQERKS